MQTRHFSIGVVSWLVVVVMFVLGMGKVADVYGQAKAAPAPTAEEVEADALMQNYYLAPRPEAIARFMALLDKQVKDLSESEITGASAPLIGFFSQVFKANPGRLSEWCGEIDKLSSKFLQQILFAGLYFSGSVESRELLQRYAKKHEFLQDPDFAKPAPSLFDYPLVAPSLLDMYWGAFFATGDLEYPRRIMACACSEQPEGGIDMSIMAARWSVVSIAQQHQLVRDMINEQLRTASDDEIKRFTENISEETRQKILVADVLLKVNHLQPAPAKEADAPEEEEQLPAPQIEPGPPVDYASSKVFAKLFKQANNRHTVIHQRNGQVVTGRLVVEDQPDSLAGVASKALFADKGIFVAPVYAGRTLRFVKHGYESLDVVIPADVTSLKNSRLDLGTQTLRKLPAERLTEVTGELRLPEGVDSAQVELWTGKLPSTFDDDGYDGQAVIKALAAKCQMQTGQQIHFAGLSPIFSELRITAPGCIYLCRPFEAGKELDLGIIALQRCQHATFRLAQMDELSVWKEQTVVIDGKSKLVLVDKPDKFGQYDGWRLSYKDNGRLEATFVYYPNYFDDYGKMTPEQFIEQQQSKTLPKPVSHKGTAILKKGHLYRFRCNMRNIDMLVAFVELGTK